jgi:3-hydroxyisobutyrate dehydrogenase
MEERQVGFIGLGNMGGRMAAQLVANGWRVIGHDPHSPHAGEIGVELVGSPAEVAERADVVLLSLPDSSVVEKVVLGDEGLLEAVSDRSVVVDLSTAAPASTRRLSEALSGKGAVLIDAGVSGGAQAAEQGTLSIMAGGPAEVLESIAPVLDVISSTVFHMGPSGAGHSAKILNNFLNGVSLAATAEVMVAARKAGLDLAVFLDVLNSSSGVNFATLNRFPKIIKGDYLEGGLSSRLMLKDLLLYVDHARELGVASLNAAGSVASFGLAAQLGYGDQISNRVVDAIGDVSGGVRLS